LFIDSTLQKRASNHTKGVCSVGYSFPFYATNMSIKKDHSQWFSSSFLIRFSICRMASRSSWVMNSITFFRPVAGLPAPHLAPPYPRTLYDPSLLFLCIIVLAPYDLVPRFRMSRVNGLLCTLHHFDCPPH